MRSSVAEFADRALRVAQETLQEAKDNVRKDQAQYYKENLELTYAEAVSTWYQSYIPSWYNRTYQLYSLFDTKVDAEGYVEWEISEDLHYPSLWGSDKPFDPFSHIVEGGLHGGWLGSHAPVYSAPIPQLFLLGEQEIKYDRLLATKNEFYRLWAKNKQRI